MHVVLVLPPFDMVAAYGSARKVQRGNIPSLGVGYLAASLGPHGHTVRLLDAASLGLGVEETVEQVAAEEPDVIGISCLTRQEESAYALARQLRERCFDVRLVMGGAHTTAFAETVLEECPSIDILVPGEGELVFAELVDRLASEVPYDDLPGLVYRDAEGAIRATPVAEPVEDLDTIPNPARHIYQQEFYIPLPNQCRRTPATTAMTARGCPWARCGFCYQGGRYAQPYRRRSPGHVVDEVARLVRDYGIRQVSFWDDNFCVMPEWIGSFCDLLDKESLDLVWTVQARIDTVRPEMLRRMAASGCYNVHFGFETGKQELLDLIDKGITLEQSRNAVAWAKKAGMEVRGSFMLGLPTETPEMAEKTVAFACELNVDWAFFVPYHVQRGTRMEKVALQQGVLLKEELDLHVPQYLPNTYASAEQLTRVVQAAYRRYYLRPRYIARALWQARRPATLRNYVSAAAMWLHLMGGNRGRP